MRLAASTWPALAAVALLGCAPPPPPPPPPPPAPAPVSIPAPTVWTREAGVVVRAGASSTVLPYPFTRLEVVGADSAGLRVRCPRCAAPEGSVEGGVVVHEAPLPGEAATGDLATFALAVRQAAAARDIRALRPVMHPEFTFSFVGLQGRDEAIAAWTSESWQTLDRVPELLDRGLASPDGSTWAAPPAFSETLDYRGLRLGFRRDAAGRWQWLYLIQGLVSR